MGMLLSVRGIRKSFGAVAALRHADLDMAEGEVVALLGDNGAGKSTFVRLLSGAGRPDGGTFRLIWRNTASARPGIWASRRCIRIAACARGSRSGGICLWGAT